MFFTDLDSRAAVRGSRDPLGLVPIWSRFGRGVIGNLTTVTNSVRGFTTLITGLYFAESAQQKGGAEGSTLEYFLKFEQLAGYARKHVSGQGEFRGVERVSARLAASRRVWISSQWEHQILSNQKTYGLWGLFSVAARASGLLSPGEGRLTAAARTFIELEYLPPLSRAAGKDGRAIVDLLRRDPAALQLESTHRLLAEAVATIHSPVLTPAESAFYAYHLADGGPLEATGGLQPRLSHLLARLPRDTAFSMAELTQVIQWAHQEEWTDLEQELIAIARLEPLLVAMSSAFSFMLTRDRQDVSAVAREMQLAWGRSLTHLSPEALSLLLPTLTSILRDEAPARRLIEIATHLRTGHFEAVIRLLLEHNREVMQSRNGSQAWVRVDGDRLDVRYRDESGGLIPRDLLPEYWSSTYFIDSLKSIVTQTAA
jgi:hypothetical protein